jgi:hypothetical protein
VTGVQTCALPISKGMPLSFFTNILLFTPPIFEQYDCVSIKYSYGLDFKPKIKIDQIINLDFNDVEPKLEVIRYNVNKFKSLNNLH